MTTKTRTTKDLQAEIRKDRPSADYLEITGIKKNNIKNLPRDTQREVESFIGTKTLTIWIRR
jgi:hypothetical protein|tara:strand:+ start:1928 stop:2113 length:186 start_codon:yes stop_codon:yes gene_type:complete